LKGLALGQSRPINDVRFPADRDQIAALRQLTRLAISRCQSSGVALAIEPRAKLQSEQRHHSAMPRASHPLDAGPGAKPPLEVSKWQKRFLALEFGIRASFTRSSKRPTSNGFKACSTLWPALIARLRFMGLTLLTIFSIH
jgi:hypothetical protein